MSNSNHYQWNNYDERTRVTTWEIDRNKSRPIIENTRYEGSYPEQHYSSRNNYWPDHKRFKTNRNDYGSRYYHVTQLPACEELPIQPVQNKIQKEEKVEFEDCNLKVITHQLEVDQPNAQVNILEDSKSEFEEIKREREVSDESNKKLRENMVFLIKDNTFLLNDNRSLLKIYKEVKDELEKLKEENLTVNKNYEVLEVNNKELEKSLLIANECNAHLCKKFDIALKNAQKVEIQNKKYKEDLDKTTDDYNILHSKTMQMKDEKLKIEELKKEIIELEKKCQNGVQRNADLKMKNKKVEKESKELKEKIAKMQELNEQINDLKSTLDVAEGNLFLLNGNEDKLKTSEQNNVKLRIENDKLKELLKHLTGDVIKKMEEVESKMDENAELGNSTLLKHEIFPGSGVYCQNDKWEVISKCKTAQSFCRKLLVAIFDEADLIKCSFKGASSKRPALDPIKVEALTSCVLARFSGYTAPEVTSVANTRLMELRKIAKRRLTL